MKEYVEKNTEYHEIPVGSYIADIKKDDNIFEIQTQNFKALVNKVEYYINCGYNVSIVYPIIRSRYINWIKKDTNTVVNRRKSPLKGMYIDCLPEIYWIKHLFSTKKLNLKLVMVDIEDYRHMVGYKSTKDDKIVSSILEELNINKIEDLHKILPNNLPNEFSSKDFPKSKNRILGSGLKLLRELGVIQTIRKEGNLLIYKINRGIK